jgi:hypothetical protein
MQIKGKCHCGNISYALDWPSDEAAIVTRACSCTFCTKHGGNWTSHRDAVLTAEIRDASLVWKYRFGTKTAVFHVCSRCGVVPFVSSVIDDHVYAVVNANTFDDIDPSSLARMAANFDGEGTGDRLERRKRNWIRAVRISGA